MIVFESSIYIVVLVLAVLFTYLTFTDEAPVVDEEHTPAVSDILISLVRRPVFAITSAIIWAIWSGMSETLNNCDFNTGTCFTSSFESTTTTVVHVNPFSQPLSFLGWGFFFLMLVLGIVFILITALGIIRGAYLFSKRRAE